MKLINLLFLLLPLSVNGQVISTYAGTGVAGGSGDGGLATNATLAFPVGVSFDNRGNILICEEDGIRDVNINTGIISTIAGCDTATSTGNGRPATDAQLVSPYFVYSDTVGNLYVTDYWTSTVRKIDISTNWISDYAGNNIEGYSGDGGPATSAKLDGPFGVCIDATRHAIFFSDEFNYRVRKVDMSTNIITTFAGTGIEGYSGDGGLATNARFSRVIGLQIDKSGNLYIGDWDNGRIRKIDATTNIVSTIAGNGVVGYSGDGGAATDAMISKASAMCFDKCGNLYFADEDSSIIRRIDVATNIITTVAGNGFAGDTGIGGAATSASLNHPNGVCIDTSGNLYISDYYNHMVYKVTIPTTCDLALDADLISKESDISIYPNPIDNILNLTSKNKISEVTIDNLIGQQVYDQVFDAEKAEINVSAFPPGIYFVQVTDGTGNVFVRKVQKE